MSKKPAFVPVDNSYNELIMYEEPVALDDSPATPDCKNKKTGYHLPEREVFYPDKNVTFVKKEIFYPTPASPSQSFIVTDDTIEGSDENP